MKTISKNTFKKKVKSEATAKAIRYLNDLKDTHSKLNDISVLELKPQAYLTDSRLSTNEVKLLFKLRTRMFGCKENFKNYYGSNLFCDLCKIVKCSQSHLLECFVLKNSIGELRENRSVKYSHIFENIELQVPAIKILYQVVKIREVLLEKLKE